LNDAEAAHADTLMAACRHAGIPAEEIPAERAIAAEPHISHAVIRAFSVPDGFVDGQELLRANALAARQADAPATFLTHHTVTGFRSSGGRITAVTVQSRQGGPVRDLHCDYVINAAGVWAGRVAGLAGVPFEMVYDKGTMIVFKHNFSGAVLNRCRPENDGDLLVPGPYGSIMGTTARVIPDPDECYPTQEEVDLLLGEGSAMVPRLRQAEAVRVYAGVRPLFKAGPTGPQDSRAIPRSFRIIDHAAGGPENIISVTGGKVTLYRRMAEAAVDMLCSKSGVTQACSTASQPIGHENRARKILAYA
jgi:glycerol-3-phosphate dehydrogenase